VIIVYCFYEELGQRIRDYLDSSGITQTQMAEQLGISKQVMSKIINGKKAISVAEISRIAELMNCSIDSLVKPEQQQENNDPVRLFMGMVDNHNTRDDLRFLDHVMDEILELDQITRALGR
jgi:transcriptional regulator with XRE-family HTH domain